MRRSLLNLLTILSLLLCAAVPVVWVRSYETRDLWLYYSPKHVDQPQPPFAMTRVYAVIERGGVGLSVARMSYTATSAREDIEWEWGYDQRGWHHYPTAAVSYAKLTTQQLIDVAGVVVSTEPALHVSGFPHPRFTVVLPLWLVMLALAVAPGLTYLKLRRARRTRASGLCPSCGYDLRATPGRCPECGTIAAEAANSGWTKPCREHRA